MTGLQYQIIVLEVYYALQEHTPSGSVALLCIASVRALNPVSSVKVSTWRIVHPARLWCARTVEYFNSAHLADCVVYHRLRRKQAG